LLAFSSPVAITLLDILAFLCFSPEGAWLPSFYCSIYCYFLALFFVLIQKSRKKGRSQAQPQKVKGNKGGRRGNTKKLEYR